VSLLQKLAEGTYKTKNAEARMGRSKGTGAGRKVCGDGAGKNFVKTFLSLPHRPSLLRVCLQREFKFMPSKYA
jgi:hypothetical protein